MYKILTLNAISETGLSRLSSEDYIVSSDIKDPDGVIVRSFDMHKMELPKSLLAVARAGAGTNNIPLEKCSENGIVVFNTPGANANAVKELVLTALLISSREVVDGIEWTKSLKGQDNIEKLVEKGKKQFVGPEIKGKKLGVIGLGAIGVLVANAAQGLGMEVLGYDPFLSVDAAWSLSSDVTRATSMEAVVTQCDYITLHIPLNDKTKHMMNKSLFHCMKKGTRLLNFSRGELVEHSSLKEALSQGIVSTYVTDFPSDEVLEMDNVLATPHLGASTPESEENCAEMAAKEMKHFLEYGNIKNSVNFPNCIMPYDGKSRVSIVHKNVPSMVSSIAAVFSKEKINIDNMMNNSKSGWAYTLIDADDLLGRENELVAGLESISGVVCVRVIRQG